MKFKEFLSKATQSANTRAAKAGSYSFMMAVLVLAVLIAVNIAVGGLPAKWTKADISAARLYSVTAATKSVVQNLADDVTVYWVTQSGKEDAVIGKLLDVYDGLSDKLSVVTRNPDVYPTFTAQYTADVVLNNSLIVESGDRYRYIPFTSIYVIDEGAKLEASTQGEGAEAVDVSDIESSLRFDGESVITTSIDFVTSDELPMFYLIKGHGEEDPSATFANSLMKANIETQSISLLNVDRIPKDAAGLVIYCPKSDFSVEEIEMLSRWVNAGGRLLVIDGPPENVVEKVNLESLLTDMGVKVYQGVVLEPDRDHFAMGNPLIILPNIEENEITSSLIENDSLVMSAISYGMNTRKVGGDIVLTDLLTTNKTSYLKSGGYALKTYDYEEGDIDGPFCLAAAFENGGDGRVVWICSGNIIKDAYNSYSSGANSDFVMNCVSWLVGETEPLTIRSKSMDYNYLTISANQSLIIKAIMIVLVPLVFLIFGIDDLVKRKRRNV